MINIVLFATNYDSRALARIDSDLAYHWTNAHNPERAAFFKTTCQDSLRYYNTLLATKNSISSNAQKSATSAPKFSATKHSMGNKLSYRDMASNPMTPQSYSYISAGNSPLPSRRDSPINSLFDQNQTPVNSPQKMGFSLPLHLLGNHQKEDSEKAALREENFMLITQITAHKAQIQNLETRLALKELDSSKSSINGSPTMSPNSVFSNE